MTRLIIKLAISFTLATTGFALAQTVGEAEGGRQTIDLPPVVAEELASTSGHPVIEPLGGDRYKIGNLEIDRSSRELRLKGKIATLDSPLEYLACAPGGKLYESLLEFDVNPYHLHVGLLLIGLEPKNNLDFQGDPSTPQGDPVTVLVSWQNGGESVWHRAEELIWQKREARPMEETNWVFSGSLFVDDVFLAAVEKSLIAVYNDPAAILNNPLPTGADDESYVSRTDYLPPSGTALEIIIRPADGQERD